MGQILRSLRPFPAKSARIINFKRKFMSNLSHEKSFILDCDIELKFSVFDDKLLFLHSKFMSGQYILDRVAIYVKKQPKNVKVSFTSTDHGLSNDYQSYYFKSSEYYDLVTYFQALRFKATD